MFTLDDATTVTRLACSDYGNASQIVEIGCSLLTINLPSKGLHADSDTCSFMHALISCCQ